MRLTGKTILVVGGTSGIGLSAAAVLAGQGARVAVMGLDEPSCQAARQQLGPDVLVLQDDATRPRAAVEAVQATRDRFGRFDGLYHVAGGSGRRLGDGPLHELSEPAIDYTLRLNLTSVLYSNQAAVQDWLRHGQAGAVLNLASVLAFAPAPRHFGTVVYAAAKAAVLGLTRSAAAMYAPHNIRFNALAPGLVDTPSAARALADPATMVYVTGRQALEGGRAARTSDLDGAAVYLLSDEARFVTGQVLAVDGGWSACDGSPPQFGL
ncbi:MAG: SDR family oxidoreductase [Pirellulaceae bacterium]|nr:SDR family oxidoreductase [Pirellulaceae bacterium]